MLVSEELGDDGGLGDDLVFEMVVGVFDCGDETALGDISEGFGEQSG